MKFADAVYRPGFHSLVDTHSHYNLDPIYENWRQHWDKAQQHGVTFAWVPGTNLETSRRAVELAEAEKRFTPFVGIHPGEVALAELDLETTLSQLGRMRQRLLDADRDLGGIGEIGLDYYRLSDDDQHSREEQRVWFRAQLRLAHEWEVPVILHVRDTELPEEPAADTAYWDVLRIIEDEGFPAALTMHCLSGPKAYVQRMLDLGAYAGFDGNITYPNAHEIRELWRLVPDNRRFLETDVPYLPPQGYRGQICEPWMIDVTRQWLEEQG